MGLIKNNKLRIPDTYVLVVIFIIIAAIMTYIIPAGEYTMIENTEMGIKVADPNSYHMVKQQPITFEDIILAIPIGMQKSASIINMLFLLSGFLQIVNDTGAIDRFINGIIYRLKNKSLVVLPIIIIMMMLLGAVGAIVNGVVAFIPLGLIIARKLKLNSYVAVLIIFVATYTGFGASPIYPSTLQLAQKIADVQVLSGFGFRVVVLTIITIILIVFTVLHSKKLLNNQTFSEENHVEKADEIDLEKDEIFTFTDILIIIVLFGGFGVYAYGTIKYGWGTEYMSGIMFVIAVITAIIDKISPDQMVKSFISGCKGVVYACLITGFASGISYILNEGKIIHTIVYFLSSYLNNVGRVVSSYLMLFINMILNFLIPSGSGQAAVVMPLMAPLSDIIELDRQIAVCTYQWGDLLTNLINPTSGTTMAVLGLAGIPYNKWLKFILPLLLFYLLVILITLTVLIVV